MANYFDNQDKWSWQVSDKEVLVTTDHGNHTHTLEVTNVPIGEMVENTGQVMGDAHRAASHDFKEEAEMETMESEIDVGEEIDASEGIDDGEGCDDGLDI